MNNAYTGVNTIITNMGKKFWEVSEDQWDVINGVGLRGHYLCTVKASRYCWLMICHSIKDQIVVSLCRSAEKNLFYICGLIYHLSNLFLVLNLSFLTLKGPNFVQS